MTFTESAAGILLLKKPRMDTDKHRYPCPSVSIRGFLTFFFLGTILFSLSASAGSLPSERLKDPAQESRAVAIFTQLRCLVCQNETIADSDARIAQDLRLLVRTRIQKGDSDKDIVDFIHGRYGDFVLMKPPVKPATWALWFSPLMLLLIGIMVVAGILHRQKQKPPEQKTGETQTP